MTHQLTSTSCSTRPRRAKLTDHFGALMGDDLAERVSREAEVPELVSSGVGSSMNRVVPLAGAYSNPHVQEQIAHLYSLFEHKESV